jgi:hypothetical protein
MLEYRGKLEGAIDSHIYASPVQRLKVFEEECQGLFAPLDLSPVTVVDTTAPVLDDASAHLPPPSTLLDPSGFRSRDVGSGENLVPESTSAAEESMESQQTGSVLREPTPQPAERPRRWYHILFSCVT